MLQTSRCRIGGCVICFGWLAVVHGMFCPAEAHESPEMAQAEAMDYESLKQRFLALEKEVEEHRHFGRVGPHEHGPSGLLKGLSITGQMTAIYQTSSLGLKSGDLVDDTGVPLSDLGEFKHKNGAATFSADLFVEKEFDPGCYFLIDFEFANGMGVDAPLQGGGMVNNDVMEDPDHHNQPYIARAYYEHTLPLAEGYNLIFDIGKFGIPDFFDQGDRVTDQTTQVLNQAICNNGAFDYPQDLEGHGYTYGIRAAADTPWVTLSGAFLSADSYLDNIRDKYSVIGELDFKIEYAETIKGTYRIYAWKNYGEYARFDSDGNLESKDLDLINTQDNADNLDKAGFGISLDQSLPWGINVFGRYGRQDDDRDVRHYQDMDESIMFGLDVSGENWGRCEDVLGIAYEIGRLIGNHRKAHEKGYQSFFTRPGIGGGNYADERVLDIYYRLALSEHASLSLDYQHINNFYYSRKIGDADFWGTRFHVSF